MGTINSEKVKSELLHFFSTKTKKEVLLVSTNTYIYRGFRFTFQSNNTLDVRYIKYDKEDFYRVYEYGKSRSIKSYFYKTTLLLHQKVDLFCNLSLNEFENRG